MDFEGETLTVQTGYETLSMRSIDALIIKTETNLAYSDAEKLARQMKTLLGVSQVLVLAPDANIAVLRVGASE